MKLSFSTPVPKRGRIRILLGVVVLVLLVRTCWKPCKDSVGKHYKNRWDRNEVAAFLESRPFDSTLLSEHFYVKDGDNFKVDLTILPSLQKRLHVLFERYHPRCGAAFVFRPASGEVLAAASYRNPKEEEFLPDVSNMVLWHKYLAASIFKIIAAASAIENRVFNLEDTLSVTGRNYTLYRYQLKDKKNRWTRTMNLREAFTRSINPFFGKLGQDFLGAKRLNHAAERFLFNKQISFDIPVDPSLYRKPQSPYACAEIACGYNDSTELSPIHAAVIGGAICADGIVKPPYIVKQVTKDGAIYYKNTEKSQYNIISDITAVYVRDLMEGVIRKGTARTSFKHIIRSSKYSSLKIGGKTGSLDADLPKGRCDWFVGYAYNPGQRADGIAVAVVTVHGAFWTVHSAYIAAEVIRCWTDLKTAKVGKPEN
jgi:cell division protein FtsI/penicillin-binding protein 2